MKKISVILIFLISAANLFSGEILLKQLGFATELLIRFENSSLLDEVKSENSITLVFEKPVEMNIANFSDTLIKKISTSNNKLIVEHVQNVTVDTITEKNEIRVLISKKKIESATNIKNVIEKPISVKGADRLKDPVAEAELLNIKNRISNLDYENAIIMINDTLNRHKDDIYAQEAYFLLGKIYMDLGVVSPKNYMTAAAIFEDFTKKYPSSYLYADALWNTALAKEYAELYYEAVFEYRSIINSLPDTELSLNAHKKIAQIYENIGQLDKAIENYQEILKKVKSQDPQIIAKIGSLFAQLKDIGAAYEYFSKISDYDLEHARFDEEILFNFAQVLTQKKNYDKAVEIYGKIYNLYPDGKYADLAMYNTALIFEETNKNTLASSLLLEAKNRYPSKRGGLLASIKYVEKFMESNNTDYWIMFLQNVLDSNDLNIKAKGNLLLINSFYREKNYDKALNYIQEFEKRFFDTPYLSDAYEIKQKIYLDMANNSYSKNEYVGAKNYLQKLISEFPDTKFKDKALTLLEDIKYDEARLLFFDSRYLETIRFIENVFSEHEKIYMPKRWYDLLGSSYYEYAKILDLNGDIENTLMILKSYFINLQDDSHRDVMKKILSENMLKKFNKLSKDKNHIEILKSYFDNNSWLKYLNKESRDTILSYVAYSYYALGVNDKAKDAIQKVEGVKNNNIFTIKLLLRVDTGNYDINNLTFEELQFLTDEFFKNDPLRGYYELKKYTKSKELSLIAQGKLIKKIEDKDIKRSFYDEVTTLNNYNSAEMLNLLFESGIFFYNEREFQKAKTIFSRLISEKGDEVLLGNAKYYLGKIYLFEKDEEKAYIEFKDVVDNYRNAIFYNQALAELEDLNWKRKIKK